MTEHSLEIRHEVGIHPDRSDFVRSDFRRGQMREFKTQFQPEFDYDDAALEGNAAVSAKRYSNLSVVAPESRAHSWRYLRVKRGIDVAGSLMILAMSLIPGLVIAAVIALTSDGPVFYRETRIGRGGRRFRIWKFRSMCTEAKWREIAAVESSSGVLLHWRIHKNLRDPRITAVGGFLRRWSLDELPQVLNVLRGEMSLVGPRPVIEAEVPMYGHLQHFYLAATPGLSGLWQVSGRSNVDFAARAKLDAFYVRNWSLRRDFEILFRTLPAVFGRVGAR